MGSLENCGATFEAIITIRAAQSCGRMNERHFKLVESSLIGAGWQQFDTADIQRIGFVEISPTLSPPLQRFSVGLCTSCSVWFLSGRFRSCNYKTRQKCKPDSALCLQSFSSFSLTKQTNKQTNILENLMNARALKKWLSSLTVTGFGAVKFGERTAEGTSAHLQCFQCKFVIVVFLIVLPIISPWRLNSSNSCVHFKGVYCIINDISRLHGDNGRAILVSETVIWDGFLPSL